MHVIYATITLGCYRNFIGNFYLSTKFHQYSFMLLHMKSWLLQQQTGKSVKNRGAQTSADAPQPSQAKRKGPKSTKSQPKRQRTAPSPPPRPASPIHVESSPTSPEIQTQQVPSPPRPAPQLQEAPADVPEQITDLADLSISSVVPPDQTDTAPPQGKVMTIALSPTDLSLQIIIILVISQLTSFHRQPQPINP